MKPHVLIILDGWGIAEAGSGNAITQAATPRMDEFAAGYPSTQLEASGPAVGLPPDQDGNSEVGHLNLGSGRIVYQELPRISIQVADGQFFTNEPLVAACQHAKEHDTSLALIGLIGTGTVHSSQEHLHALLKLAAQQGLRSEQVQLHLFTDGRDSPQDAALDALKEIEDNIEEYGVGIICSIAGRYYAMDRNKTWDRTERAYKTITEGIGERALSAREALKQSYREKLTDEFILPTIIVDEQDTPLGTVTDGDAVIFFNYRADRARQLTQAFVLPRFTAFERSSKRDLFFVTMTEYEKELPVQGIAYTHENVSMSLAETIAHQGLKQFHIAETEKYAHVTYFFNGRREEPFIGEERLLVPSPSVATYDEQPEMSAAQITSKVIEKIETDAYDFIVLNFANADMVAHTGNIDAAISAIQHLDECIGKIVDTVLAKEGTCLITADHGNAEEMKRGTWIKEEATKHTTNPVPLIIVGAEAQEMGKALEEGVLGDVAPTILYLMNIPQPMEMTGRVLFH